MEPLYDYSNNRPTYYTEPAGSYPLNSTRNSELNRRKRMSAYKATPGWQRFLNGVTGAARDLGNASLNAAKGVANTVNKAPQTFYDNIARSFLGKNTSPESEGLIEQARLQEQYAAQRAADAQQNRQIVNRDERQEAAKDAVSKSASINDQKVANLGGAAGVGAAALARENITPEIDQLRQRQDIQRREAVQNEDEMYRLYEDAIMRRYAADASDKYDTTMQRASDKGEQLARGVMTPNIKERSNEIQEYIDNILRGKQSIEDVPDDIKEAVNKIGNVQKKVLSIINLQNYINAQAEAADKAKDSAKGKDVSGKEYDYPRYELVNGIVKVNYNPDDNYRKQERTYGKAVYDWFNSNYPNQKMNDVRYKLFKEATGHEIGNYPEQTRQYLQECIDKAKGGIQ